MLLQTGDRGELVRPVRAVRVAEPARSPRQLEDPVEDVERSAPRSHGIGQGLASEARVRGPHGPRHRVVWIGLAPRIGVQLLHLDHPESLLVQVVRDGGGGAVGFQVRNQPDVQNRPGHVGDDGLSAGARVAGLQAVDVRGGPEDQDLEHLLRRAVELEPGRASLLQVPLGIESCRQLPDQGAVAVCRRRSAVEQLPDPDGLIRTNEGRQRVHEGPHGRRDPRCLAGVKRPRGTAPVPAAALDLEREEPLATQDEVGGAGEIAAQVEVHARVGGQVRRPLAGDERKVRAAELLLSLDHEPDRHGNASGRTEQIQGAEERRQRPLGVRRPPPHHRGADVRKIEDLRGERGRGPVGLLGRLHVVHAVSKEPGGAGWALDLAQHHGVARGLHQLGAPACLPDQLGDHAGHLPDPLAGGGHGRHSAERTDALQVRVEPGIEELGELRRTGPVRVVLHFRRGTRHGLGARKGLIPAEQDSRKDRAPAADGTLPLSS